MPEVLVDWPDDGLDERGWVSVDKTAEEARALLVPMLLSPDLLRLADAPKRVWLRPEPEDDDLWVPCEPTDDGAAEFWEFRTVEIPDGHDECEGSSNG